MSLFCYEFLFSKGFLRPFSVTYGGEGHGLIIGPDQVGSEDDRQVGRRHLVHITAVNNLETQVTTQELRKMWD